MSRSHLYRLLALLPFFFFTACAEKEKEVDVQSIAISQPSAEMEIGETLSLKATVSPSNASYDGLTWTSTNPKVASVSESGLVSAISEGNTTITVMAGGKTASCSVSVASRFVAVSSISLSKTSMELVKGESVTLTASVSPDEATDKSVIWTSNAPSIASVDENGKVSAINGGSATITVKAGDKTATCAVTVVVPVESVTLDKESLTLIKGESAILTATVKPDDATEKNLTWSSSDETIVSVDQNGKVSAVKGGEAMVTVNAGGKTSTCTVTVIVPVESITISQSSVTLVEGQSVYLTATVYPQDATDKTVVWSSSQPGIVSVENGSITALSKGQATITASSGDFSASCDVTVLSEADLDLENNVSVRLSSQSSYGIAYVNGNQFYSRKYTITNRSIVSIYVYKVTAPNCSYFSYPQTLMGDITIDMTQTIGSSLGTVMAGKTFEFTLYSTTLAAQDATICFRYNGHEYQVTGK